MRPLILHDAVGNLKNGVTAERCHEIAQRLIGTVQPRGPRLRPMPDTSTIQLISAALGGGAVSGLIAAFVALRIKRLELGSEDQARFAASRQEAYATFSSGQQEVYWYDMHMAARRRTDLHAVEADRIWSERGQSGWEKVRVSMGLIEILAPDEVLAAAETLVRATRDLHELVTNPGVDLATASAHAFNEPAREARDKFRTAARRDLAVTARSRGR